MKESNQKINNHLFIMSMLRALCKKQRVSEKVVRDFYNENLNIKENKGLAEGLEPLKHKLW